MEWWQYLIVSIVTVSLGAFLGYFFNRLGAKNEKSATEQRQLKSAVSAILGEVQANETIAKAPWTGTQLPFLTEMWSLYKSQISMLPMEVRRKIDELYITVIRTNAIVSQDLHKLGHGTGYLDGSYKELSLKISEDAPQIVTLLQNLLDETG